MAAECGKGAGRGEQDGDADLTRLVDQIVCDAGAGKGDETLRQEVQQVVVAPEGRGLIRMPCRRRRTRRDARRIRGDGTCARDDGTGGAVVRPGRGYLEIRTFPA